MNLTLKDVSALFEVEEKTVLKWIQEDNLPAYIVNDEYFLNRDEVDEWAEKRNLCPSYGIIEALKSSRPISIKTLLERGGIHRGVKGRTPHEVFVSASDLIPLPPELSKKAFVMSLLEREEEMTTAIGRGIAIPHPGTPVINEIENESASLLFLDEPVDFNSIDGQPVSTLFIVLAANQKRHLDALAQISYLCHKDSFTELLDRKAPAEKIFEAIEKYEAERNKKNKK